MKSKGPSIHSHLMNTAHLNMKDLTGSLQYVVSDIMDLAPEELPAEDSLACYHTDLEQLLDPKLLITYAYWICKAKGLVFCERVFGAWKSTMRSLPSSACSPSLLHRFLALLTSLEDADDIMRAADPPLWQDQFEDFHDKWWPGDSLVDFFHTTFASMTIEFVRQKLDARTIEEAFCRNENEEKVKCLWKFVGGDRWYRRNARHRQALRSGLGAEVMMALIEKGLPEWCWAGPLGPYNDNLLQYIIEPIAAQPMYWHDGEEEEAIGRLCEFLAKRFSLEELFRENEKGEHVIYHVSNLRDFFCNREEYWNIWIQVHRVILYRIVPCVRDFQGSLPQLIKLAQNVHYGLQGSLSLMQLCFDIFEGTPESPSQKLQCQKYQSL